MNTPSWKAIAEKLAERMSYHAYCDTHPEREATPDTCPFCADRAAYRLWEAKSGMTYRPPPDDNVRIIDVFRTPFPT